jgi:hypothetical protein
VRKAPSDESIEQKIKYEMPDGSLNTWSHCGVLPEGTAEDAVEIEAAEEVPERSEVVKGAVRPDEELVALEKDTDVVVDLEELPSSLVVEVVSSSSVDAELEELVTDETPELLVDIPMLELALTLILTPLELDTNTEEVVASLLLELNLPGKRFKCVSLSPVTTSLPANFLK